jgi:hypothetical protein
MASGGPTASAWGLAAAAASEDLVLASAPKLETLDTGPADPGELTGDDKAVASHYRRLNKAQRDGKEHQHRFAFAGAPNDLANAFVAVEAMPEIAISRPELARAAAARSHLSHPPRQYRRSRPPCLVGHPENQQNE